MSRAEPYAPSALVEQLHALPHYDFDFQPVSNDFAPDNENYIQALVQFALPFLVGSVATVVVVLCCRRCGRKRGGSDSDDGSTNGALRAVTGFAVIAAVLSAIYFYGNQELSNSVTSFLNSVDEAQTFFDGFFDSAANLQTSVAASQAALDNTAVPDDEKNAMTATLSGATASTEAILANRDVLSINGFNEEISAGDSDRYIGFMIFGLMLVACALGYLWIRKNTGGPQRSVLCLGTLVSFLAFFAAGLCLMFAVGVADFCAAPNNAILDALGDSSDLAAFYVNCPEGEANPLVTDVTNASAEINKTIETLDTVQGVDVTELRAALVQTSTAADGLVDQTGCEALNSAYVNAVKSLCNPGLTGLFCVLVIAALIAVLLTLAAAVVMRRGPPNKGYARLSSTSLMGADRKYSQRSDPLVEASFDDPAKSPYYGSTSRHSNGKRRNKNIKVEA
mmetsp:Transcript_23755/g.62086  ORF Transcript_23755/g.62086 Transcript_23755/m.62086 type:complete len:451 (-) Transcript_23755:56-1408(-)